MFSETKLLMGALYMNKGLLLNAFETFIGVLRGYFGDNEGFEDEVAC